MSKRQIIEINEKKCNGCGLCIPNCPEGAIQIIDKKARLISDLFCDGLGACLGHCPQGAITVIEREAKPYDERLVMANIVKQGIHVVKAHLKHLHEHHEDEFIQEALEYLKEQNIVLEPDRKSGCPSGHGGGGCPGSRMVDMRKPQTDSKAQSQAAQESELRQWPVQLTLVPPLAPYLNESDLLIAADCVPFAYANFHQDLLKDRTLLVGCPKLDDMDAYKEKIEQILEQNTLKSITYAHMEVPCCSGLIRLIQDAIKNSGKNIPFKDVTIGINGERQG